VYDGKISSSVLENPYYQRLDLNADGYVLVSDVLLYYGKFGQTCD
jgi:hypothetical protein